MPARLLAGCSPEPAGGQLARSPNPAKVTRGGRNHQVPSPPVPACHRGHLTHRGASQDQERPQLFSEGGQPQAARPMDLKGGLRASAHWRGLLRSLHVTRALRPGSAEAGSGYRAAQPALQSPPRPPAQSPPHAWRPGARLSAQPGLGRAPCTSLCTTADACGSCKDQGTPALGRQSLKKLWKLTERAPGAGSSKSRTPGLTPALHLRWGFQVLNDLAWKDPEASSRDSVSTPRGVWVGRICCAD